MIPLRKGLEAKEFEECGLVSDVEPIFMLPPPLSSKWVLKKVVEVKRRLGYTFQEIEKCVEDFFWEIEGRRSQSPKRPAVSVKQLERGKHSRELKKLDFDINYEGGRKGRGEKGGDGLNQHPTMMKVICSWNIRGLRKEEKQWGLREMLRRWKVDLITL